jgi:hypothetical protein
MDPNQAVQDWLDALRHNDDVAAVEAAQALVSWLERGGAEPARWNERQKCVFISWCDAHEIFPEK